VIISDRKFSVELHPFVTGFWYEHDGPWFTNIILLKEFIGISKVSEYPLGSCRFFLLRKRKVFVRVRLALLCPVLDWALHTATGNTSSSHSCPYSIPVCTRRYEFYASISQTYLSSIVCAVHLNNSVGRCIHKNKSVSWMLKVLGCFMVATTALYLIIALHWL
jgi:hypothetical protein